MAKGDLKLEIIIDGKKAEGTIKNFGKTAEKALKGGIKQSNVFSSGLSNLASTIVPAMIAAFAFDKILDGFSDAINLASDYEESLNKVTAVFGDASDEMIAFTSNSAKQFGIAKGKALELAGGIGSVVKAMGFGITETADLSKQIIQMSTDIGSFNNLPTEDVINKITKSLTGEREGLKSLGVVVNEERIKQEAALQGITGQLSIQQKAMLTLNLVQKDTADSVGDFARTSGGLANQTKILNAQLENISITFGQLLLPAVNAVLKPIGSLLDFFENLGKTELEKINADIANFRIEMEGAGASAEELAKIDLRIKTQTAQDKFDDLNNQVKNLLLSIQELKGPPIFLNLKKVTKGGVEGITELKRAIKKLNDEQLPLFRTVGAANERIRQQAKVVKNLKQELEGVKIKEKPFGGLIGFIPASEKVREKLEEISKANEKLNKIIKERDNEVSTSGKLSKIELENLQNQTKALKELIILIDKRTRAEIIKNDIISGQREIDAAIAKRKAAIEAAAASANDKEKQRIILLNRLKQKTDEIESKIANERKKAQEKEAIATEEAIENTKRITAVKKIAASEAERIQKQGTREVFESEDLKQAKIRENAKDEIALRQDLQQLFKEMNGQELRDFINLQEEKKKAGEDWSKFQQDLLDDANKALFEFSVKQVSIIFDMLGALTEAFGAFADEQRAIREQEALERIEDLEARSEEFEIAEEERFERADEIAETDLERKNMAIEDQLAAETARIKADKSLSEEEKKNKIAIAASIADRRKKIAQDEFNRLKKDRAQDKQNSIETRREELRDKIDQIKRASEKQGVIEKAVAISRTTIAMFEGATKAFSALAGIPIIGPVLGAAAATAAIAAGTSNIARIIAAQEGAVVDEPTLTLLAEKRPEIVLPQKNASDFVQSEIKQSDFESRPSFDPEIILESNNKVISAINNMNNTLQNLELTTEIAGRELAILVEAGTQEISEEEL